MNLSGNIPKTPGYASFQVERMTNGSIAVTNLAQNGEPIKIIKLLDSNGNVFASGVALEALQELGRTVYIAPAINVPSGEFKLTIVGQTADGGENILQTITVSAADSSVVWPTPTPTPPSG